MKDLNQAMKKLQESKRAQSNKLAKLVKESVVEPENKEDLFDGKYNYKVVLDNGKTITATCSKENLADAKEYFLSRTYLNSKTGEKAKVVDVEEIKEDNFEEIKNEDFGSKSKELTDNDPSMKKPYDSEADKNLQNAATKDAKIVAEEFGNKSKELNDNDPAQGKPYESDAVKDIKNAAKKQPKIVAEEFGSDAKGLNDNDPSMKKPFESETKKEMDDATKGKRINNKVDESKKLEESVELSNEQKLEKAKELIEVIFSMETLDETRRTAKKELRDLVFPQRTPEETEQLPEKKIVKESIFDNDEETKIKEDRLADLRTQLEVDGEQLADDEKEAIQAEIDSLENDLYESKQLKENIASSEDCTFSLKINCNNDAFGGEGDEDTLINETKRILNEVANKLDYTDKETILDSNGNKVGVYGFGFEGVMSPLDEAKQLNEGTKGKTLEVIYTDKDGEEKTTHFECDKEYELDGEQIREAIKSSDSDIVDIIKINESKCLTEDDDHEEDEDEEKEETLEEIINRAYEEELSAINTYDLVLNKIENEESNEKLIEMINEIKKDEEDHESLLKHYIETGEALTDDELEELKNSEESNEDEDEDSSKEEEEISIENIDDETFTEAFTKFIKENYKNAKEFKLENVKLLNDGNYKFECKLVFNSGKETNVDLISNATLKEGKSLVRFYENKTFKHLDENKSIMTATVKLENKTLSCEALRYNYRVALKENKVATVKGIIR